VGEVFPVAVTVKFAGEPVFALIANGEFTFNVLELILLI
jgi:hypothetical protein